MRLPNIPRIRFKNRTDISEFRMRVKICRVHQRPRIVRVKYRNVVTRLTRYFNYFQNFSIVQRKRYARKRFWYGF